MRKFTEKSIIILFSICVTYTLNTSKDIVFYFLISTITSLCLELLEVKKRKYGLYLLFIGLIFYDNTFLYYFPLILYDGYHDFKERIILLLPLLFIDINSIIFLLTAISLYLSYSTYKFENILVENRSVRDKLKEDTLYLKKYNEQLKIDREKNIQIAILTERNRIAREIHDSVGHTISSSLLQVKALKLSKKNLDQGLDILDETLNKGMDDIRNSLYNLRNQSIDLEREIEKVIKETIGLDISLSYNIDDDLSYSLKYDILSVVKEAITNTYKHSNGNSMMIILSSQPKFYSIVIKDNGSYFDSSSEGIGLYSMNQIAEKYKGIFNYKFEDGFKIHLALMKGN